MVTKKKISKHPAEVFQVITDSVVFELQPEPEGGYTVTVPSLPGCITYGKNFEEAMELIKDAMEGWLATAREENIPIPRQFEEIRLARK